MSTGPRAALAAIALTLAMSPERSVAQPSIYGTSWVRLQRMPAEGPPIACGLDFVVLEPVSVRGQDAAMAVRGTLLHQVVGGVAAASLKLGADLLRVDGGKVSETGTRKDKVRGVDRNSGDLTPKNLTKKLKQTKKKAVAAADSE